MIKYKYAGIDKYIIRITGSTRDEKIKGTSLYAPIVKDSITDDKLQSNHRRYLKNNGEVVACPMGFSTEKVEVGIDGYPCSRADKYEVIPLGAKAYFWWTVLDGGTLIHKEGVGEDVVYDYLVDANEIICYVHSGEIKTNGTYVLMEPITIGGFEQQRNGVMLLNEERKHSSIAKVSLSKFGLKGYAHFGRHGNAEMFIEGKNYSSIQE